jgi:hypothetical protein
MVGGVALGREAADGGHAGHRATDSEDLSSHLKINGRINYRENHFLGMLAIRYSQGRSFFGSLLTMAE